MKRSVLIFSLVWLFTASCSDRDRINPLDPRNSETNGKITGLTLTAREHQVTLTWPRLPYAEIDSIHVYRRTELDPFQRIASLPAFSTLFQEVHLQYGNQYSYYITIRVNNYESIPSEIKTVTLGPTYTWLADENTGYIYRLSHDLQGTVARFGTLIFPYLVATNSRERSAWAFSKYSNTLYKIDSNGKLILSKGDYGPITDMVVDSTRSDLWITVERERRVLRLNWNGDEVARTEPFGRPTYLVYDTNRRYCWIIDKVSKRIFAVSGSAAQRVATDAILIAPKDLALNPQDEELWVADSTRIVKFNYEGRKLNSEVSGFFYLALLDYDTKRQELWAVDLQKVGQPATLYKFDRNGQIVFKLDQFGYPYTIAVNKFDGSCLVGDIGKRQLYRVDNQGLKIEKIGNFRSPYSLSVEYH